jgi:hypothetical protein
MTDLAVQLQQIADADHARQPLCSGCGRGGTPYEHNGVRFDGLHAHRGDRVCSLCLRARADDEGVDILVTDDRPGYGSYVCNTARDGDKIAVQLPPHLRGIDGRDARRKGKGV